MSEREREANPDDLTDAVSPDSPNFFNEGTLSAVKENELLKAELLKERGLRAQVQHDHQDFRSDLEISEEFVDAEVSAAQDFYLSEEGEQQLRQDVFNYWQNEAKAPDLEKESRASHMSSYTQRRAREERALREKIKATEKKTR